VLPLHERADAAAECEQALVDVGALKRAQRALLGRQGALGAREINQGQLAGALDSAAVCGVPGDALNEHLPRKTRQRFDWQETLGKIPTERLRVAR
jgi:hypothetical protein